jgi:hypothetical protein
VQILHLDLKPVADNYVELRYFTENPNQYEKRSLSLTEIADLMKLAERDYYVSAFPEDYTVTGRWLYNWLDGSDRTLQPLLNQHRREGIVLAIAATCFANCGATSITSSTMGMMYSCFAPLVGMLAWMLLTSGVLPPPNSPNSPKNCVRTRLRYPQKHYQNHQLFDFG